MTTDKAVPRWLGRIQIEVAFAADNEEEAWLVRDRLARFLWDAAEEYADASSGLTLTMSDGVGNQALEQEG